MGFEYYQIRPVIIGDTVTMCFLGKPQVVPEIGSEAFTREGALAEAVEYQKANGGYLVWRLYGVDAGPSVAIGDFATYEAAREILWAILSPILSPIHAAYTSLEESDVESAAYTLADILNQSTNDLRL